MSNPLSAATIGVLAGQLIRRATPALAASPMLYDAALAVAVAEALAFTAPVPQAQQPQGPGLLLPGMSPGAIISPPNFRY